MNGKQALRRCLEESGKYDSERGDSAAQDICNTQYILNRIKELLHESDFRSFKKHYKEIKKGNGIRMCDVYESMNSIVSSHSIEMAIRRVFDYRFNNHEPISRQFQYLRQLASDIHPEGLTLNVTEGEDKGKLRTVQTDQMPDLLAVTFLVGAIPNMPNPYKWYIRTHIKGYLEDISGFDFETVMTDLEEFERLHCLYEN